MIACPDCTAPSGYQHDPRVCRKEARGRVLACPECGAPMQRWKESRDCDGMRYTDVCRKHKVHVQLSGFVPVTSYVAQVYEPCAPLSLSYTESWAQSMGMTWEDRRAGWVPKKGERVCRLTNREDWHVVVRVDLGNTREGEVVLQGPSGAQRGMSLVWLRRLFVWELSR